MTTNENTFEAIKNILDQYNSNSYKEIVKIIQFNFSADLSSCPLFDYKFDEDRNVAIVEVRKNDLFDCSQFGDGINCILLESLFEEILNRGVLNVIFSFENIEYFADTSLALLLRSVNEFRGKGGSLIISDLNPTIKQIFELVELDKIVKIEKGIKEALLNF